MCKYDNVRMATIKDGEVYDSKTGHKLTVVGEDIVEMKYCTHCGGWHTLEHFYRNSKSRDGLSSWCIDCIHAKNTIKKMRNMAEEFVESVAFEEEHIVEENPLYQLANSLNGIAAQMDSRKAEYEARIADLESRLANAERKVDLTNLSEKEIETVLSSRKIQPRMLFNALKSRDSRYTFFCYDSVLGNMFPIKAEEATVAA